MMERKVKVWGGLGEKNSNKGTQWYIQNRIYDTRGISPALTTYKSDYWIVIFEEEMECDGNCEGCVNRESIE